jgi:hypothetical protein
MFSDRINWIDLIFSRLPDEAEKTQFRFSGKKAEESAMDAFSLALLFWWRNE